MNVVEPIAGCRQWTLSFPRWLRIRLLRDPTLVSELLTAFVRIVFAYHRQRGNRGHPARRPRPPDPSPHLIMLSPWCPACLLPGTIVRMPAPSPLRWLFWELDPERVDLEADEGYVIGRILEHGGLAEVRWAIGQYGLDRIHRYLREVGNSDLSDRTIGFWRAVFTAEDETWASPPTWRKSNSGPWSV